MTIIGRIQCQGTHYHLCSCNRLSVGLTLFDDLGVPQVGRDFPVGRCYPYMKTIFRSTPPNKRVYVNIQESYYYVNGDGLDPIKNCETTDETISSFLVVAANSNLYYWRTMNDGLTKSEAYVWCHTHLHTDLLYFKDDTEFMYFQSEYNTKVTTKPVSRYIWTDGRNTSADEWRWGHPTTKIQLPVQTTGNNGQCLAMNTTYTLLYAKPCTERYSFMCRLDYVDYMNTAAPTTLFTTTPTPTTSTLTTTRITTPTSTAAAITSPTTSNKVPITTYDVSSRGPLRSSISPVDIITMSLNSSSYSSKTDFYDILVIIFLHMFLFGRILVS